MTTVAELRGIAESILEQLEGVDGDTKVWETSNTFFIRDGRVLETRTGFLDYTNIDFEDDDDDGEGCL